MKPTDEDVARADRIYASGPEHGLDAMRATLTDAYARLIERLAREAEETNVRVCSESPDSGRVEPDTQGDLADWLRSYLETNNETD